MKYMIYARVSERGSGFEGQTTIPMQIKICEDYIAMRGGEVFDRRNDEFISGKNINDRPAFRAIMEELRSGCAEWDAIIVYKFSRISRSLRDSLNIVSELQEHGKGFVSATEEFDCTTTTGQLFFNMLQSFNEFERKRTADTIRDKMISIAEAGMWPSGSPPFGYKRGARKDNRLYLDERKSSIVKDIFESYLSDTPMWQIVRRYKGELARSKIFSILRDPVYLGLVNYGGKTYQGTHDPLIEKVVFDRAQDRLPQPGVRLRPKAQRYPFLLGGLIFCSCGKRMTPETAKSGQYAYYRCVDAENCKRRVSANEIEMQTINFFKSHQYSERMIKEILSEIDKDAKRVISENTPSLEKAQSELIALQEDQKKLFNLLVENINPKFISMANEKMTNIDERIQVVTARIELLKNQSKVGSEAHEIAKGILLRVKSFSEKLEKILEESPQDVAEILKLYIAKVISIDKETVKVALRMESSTKGLKWYTHRDLNPKPSGP